jgi:hypothetical protein
MAYFKVPDKKQMVKSTKNVNRDSLHPCLKSNLGPREHEAVLMITQIFGMKLRLFLSINNFILMPFINYLLSLDTHTHTGDRNTRKHATIQETHVSTINT